MSLSIVPYLGVKRFPGSCGVYGVCYHLALTGRKRGIKAIMVFIFLNLLCTICLNYMPAFNKLREHPHPTLVFTCRRLA